MPRAERQLRWAVFKHATHARQHVERAELVSDSNDQPFAFEVCGNPLRRGEVIR